jgi:hypothetical protein
LFRNIAHHPALAGDACTRANAQVIANGSLPTNHDAVANDSAASDTRLAANGAMPPKMNIVCNLNEVIESASRTDNGVTGRTSVYRAIRPDLDIIPDNDAAELRNAYPAMRGGYETKTSPPNADASGNPDTVAYQGVADASVRPDRALVAEDHPVAYDGVTADVAIRPYFGPGTDNGPSIDSRPVAYDGSRMDMRIGRYCRLWPT